MLDAQQKLVLITQYLNNPTNTELIRKLEDFRSTSVENENYFLETERIWNLSASAAKLEVIDTNSSVAHLRSFLGDTKVKRFTIPLWLKSSAACFLIFAVGFWLYNLKSTVTFLTKSTLVNQIDSVKLADGSTVILAENSVLKYPEEFDGSTRDIYLLNGQAFFKITKDPNKPFKVILNKSAVTVLGTSFNIINSPTRIDLDVKTGKVLFSPYKGGTTLVLINGQAVTYDVLNGQLITKKSQNSDAWITKELSFVDTPLEEVCVQLSKYFKVDIKLENNKRLVKKFNATFKNEDLDGVLNLLKETYNIKIEKGDEKIILKTRK